MRRLLPRMQLAGYASSIMHPLIRVIDGANEDLRREALDTVCSLALALGPDLTIFSTTILKVLAFSSITDYALIIIVRSVTLVRNSYVAA